MRGRQTDRQTDRDRHTNRQTDRLTNICQALIFNPYCPDANSFPVLSNRGLFQTNNNNKMREKKKEKKKGGGGGEREKYSTASSLKKRSKSAGCQNYTLLTQTNKTSSVFLIWDGGYKWVKPVCKTISYRRCSEMEKNREHRRHDCCAGQRMNHSGNGGVTMIRTATIIRAMSRNPMFVLSSVWASFHSCLVCGQASIPV